MKHLQLFLIFTSVFIVFYSCSRKNISVVKNQIDSENRTITEEEANHFHKYFTISAPNNWNMYNDIHGFIAYSPFGAHDNRKLNFYRVNNEAIKKKNIITNNETNTKKLGNYWDNYFDIHIVLKEQSKSNLDVINDYISKQKKRYDNKFSYKLVKGYHKQFGEISYIKYQSKAYSYNMMHLDVFLFTENSVIKLRYQTDKFYFDYYVNEVIKAVNSIKINEE